MSVNKVEPPPKNKRKQHETAVKIDNNKDKKLAASTIDKGKIYSLQISLWLSQALMDGRAIDFSQNWQKLNHNFTYEIKKTSQYNR